MWDGGSEAAPAGPPPLPPAPAPAPAATRARSWAPAGGSAPEIIGHLQENYYNLCVEKSQKINYFILHKLQEVDKEIEKGLEGLTLNIAGNSCLMPVERVTGEDFWILSRILKKNLYINGLDVRYNLISDVGAYYAARLLQLCLNENGHLHPPHPPPLNGSFFCWTFRFSMLQRFSLEKQHKLIYLNLMFNDIGPEGGELIAKALHKNTTLKYLRMTGNKIENKGGMFFAAMLQINSSLEKLDLGDCDLEESTVHLGHMLKENHCLVELHMCKHNIKNCGIKQLCDALYLNGSLRYLDVSCNKITRDGMVYLADVLKTNTTLEVLDLSFNRIENAGAKYLSETLASHNRSLKALSVVSNNIEGEGLVALSQSMKINPTLSNVYIWGNKFDEATCVAYSELMQMGRLKPDNTDVEAFVVDGHVYLAEVSNGLKKHYYWRPTYGAACRHSANAGFTLVPVGGHL
uniref:Leucine rich repeat containing 34 n=1 Tax=Canis lupus familiaris TaxID=9615 RepID=A0A8C0S8K0_CANLF